MCLLKLRQVCSVFSFIFHNGSSSCSKTILLIVCTNTFPWAQYLDATTFACATVEVLERHRYHRYGTSRARDHWKICLCCSYFNRKYQPLIQEMKTHKWNFSFLMMWNVHLWLYMRVVTVDSIYSNIAVSSSWEFVSWRVDDSRKYCWIDVL